MNKMIIYTDGGARGNGKSNNTGGWGAVLQHGDYVKEIYGGAKNTTNNIQELTGVIKALECLEETDIPVEVYSDSVYVVKGMNEWVDGWIKRGWRKADKKPVLNKELWQQLVELSNKQEDISFHWVKGHGDNEGNNRADALANLAMDKLACE